MKASMRCPRCDTDLVSSYPFGFIIRPTGPVNTYVCTGCKFLFARGDEMDDLDIAFPIGDPVQALPLSSQVPPTPPNFLLKSVAHPDLNRP